MSEGVVGTKGLEGRNLPLVGLGTWRLTGRTAYRAVRHAVDVGYRHIDTAAVYHNQKAVGKAVKDSGIDRDRIFITSKMRPGRSRWERWSINRSLSALGVDYVDLWLVHFPPRPQHLARVWTEFIAIREAGLARMIGVSNFGIDQIDHVVSMTGVAPAVNQIEWNPLQHDADRLKQHRERDIAVVGYSPLRNTPLDNCVLTEIANEHQVSAAQVVLRWHMQHEVIVIPSSRDVGHRAENFDLLGLVLTADEVGRIDGMSQAKP